MPEDVADTPVRTTAHDLEPHAGSVVGRLNWLRAGVLRANDGIISTAGLVIGVCSRDVRLGEQSTRH